MTMAVGKRVISVALVRPSVRPSCIENNSRTQRPSVSKTGRKVPHLRCILHTSFKVKRSKVEVRGGRGHAVLAEPGGHTARYYYYYYCFFFGLCNNGHYLGHIKHIHDDDDNNTTCGICM